MKYLKVAFTLIIMVIILESNISFAADKTAVENYLNENNINVNNITTSEVLTMYQDLSKEYSNDEIADMLNEYSEEIQKRGISNKAISTGTTILKQTDAETLNEVLNDVGVEEVKEKLESGDSAEKILTDIKDNMSTTQKASIVKKIVLNNKTTKKIISFLSLYIIYNVLIMGVLFIKSKEHFWATFIPIYRDIVLFRICGYSAWWIIWLFIPIIGWFIYWVLKLVMNFELSKAFGRGFCFGIGILLLKPIFLSIIAFNKKIRFIEIE